MKKMLIASVAGAALFPVSAQMCIPENPVLELFPNHITMYVNFDEKNANPVMGNGKNRAAHIRQVYEKGLFGQALKQGIGRYDPKGVVDLSAPGTVIVWYCLEKTVPKNKTEPGKTMFGITCGRRRMLGFKQGALHWGRGLCAMRAEIPAPAGAGKSKLQIYSAAVSDPIEGWTVGKWRMYAFTWTPDSVGISINGAPLKEALLGIPFGKSDKGHIEISGSAPGDPFQILVDEFVILNRKLSNAELKTLYDATLKKKLQQEKTK